ncbi:MAG: hypothetical protein A3K76_02095 [Euryarchaeota archaeon RBG_13_57_23]|nr:MAG: hypothetical protein A3K76_02095 [Euryarchaeota archaeon RBG_13_57_23]
MYHIVFVPTLARIFHLNDLGFCSMYGSLMSYSFALTTRNFWHISECVHEFRLYFLQMLNRHEHERTRIERIAFECHDATQLSGSIRESPMRKR